MDCHAPPGDLPDPVTEPRSPASPALAGGVFSTRTIWEAPRFHIYALIYDVLEKGMATHSSILAWKIPWTEEPGVVQSLELQSQTRLSN